jgi:hypothetical protein
MTRKTWNKLRKERPEFHMYMPAWSIMEARYPVTFRELKRMTRKQLITKFTYDSLSPDGYQLPTPLLLDHDIFPLTEPVPKL